MPYISLPEQGYRNPGDQIQDAARNFMVQRQMQQQLQQQSEAFPIEQQQRQATATKSTKEAAVVDKSLQLQQQAQDLQNQGLQASLAFQKETNPIRKEQLAQQVEQIKASIQNLSVQGSLLHAQTGETEARGGLYSAQAKVAGLPLLNTKISPGTLDPYGNQVITTTRSDAQGKPVQTEDTFEKGRGIPRVAYKQVWDANAGQMKRIPGVVEVDPQNGALNVQFPDDASNAEEQQNAGPDPILGKVVDRFFDAETGQRNSKQPSNAKERAQLNSLMRNSAQLNAYDLKLNNSPATPAVPSKPAAKTPTAKPAGEGVANDEGGSQPAAGVSSNGSPVKTGAENNTTKSPSAAPVPIAGAKKPGGTFKDLPIGAEFMQNGIKYKKTGDTSADPVGKAAGS